MPGIADSGGPTYISAHSADVILSDIRPIKLKIEALRSINVLLDEFLYSILDTACSLSTDKLRASLLRLLPTTLGKEALLEAEVELRAYWDRTGPADVAVLEDDAKTFQLQWAFELLRLKCEAYSTLNETDEDPGAESRINDRMGAGGGIPPKATLMAPAALYLTAILEAMCEHILSNVGRVASRDSSRTTATITDLFVALCEDQAIYVFFKTMKVYEQIAQLSKGPKSRRSKSFTRGDKHPGSATQQDLSNPNGAPPLRSRLSSESGMASAAGSIPQSSRASFEKGRAMKMFMANTRSSIDRDLDSSYKKSDSLLSEDAVESTTVEDEVMQKEFDDLMRSSATMKVSLTPDRLKTMEVYKQEKDQRSNRRPVPLSLNSDSDLSLVPPRGSPRRSTLLPVDSIKEDDEDGPIKPPRTRQASVSNPPKSFAASSGRMRAVSTSSATPRILTKFSRNTMPPVSMLSNISGPVEMPNHHHRSAKGPGNDQFPHRKRAVQHNRESIDLDDVMGESDEENFTPPPPAKQINVVTSSNRSGEHAVSATTRDLMDFLAQGPPDTGSRDVSDLFSEGPPGGEPGKSKGSKRLQKMISKLSLGGGDKSRGSNDDLRTKTPQGSSRSHLDPKSSVTNLSALANRPIPPRPPYPASPPSPSVDSFEEKSYISSRSPSSSAAQKKQNPPEVHRNEPLPPVTSPLVPLHRDREQSSLSPRPSIPTSVSGYNKSITLKEQPKYTTPPTVKTVVNGNVPVILSPIDVSQNRSPKLSPVSPTNPVSPSRIQPRKPAPMYSATPTNLRVSYDDACDMHRLMSRATSADECRVILDMILAKSGIKVDAIGRSECNTSSATTVQITPADASLEHSLVELFLGGSEAAAESRVHRQQRSEESKAQAVPTPRSSHGDTEDVDEDSSAANSDVVFLVKDHTATGE